jgi:hypothetical protein
MHFQAISGRGGNKTIRDAYGSPTGINSLTYTSELYLSAICASLTAPWALGDKLVR